MLKNLSLESLKSHIGDMLQDLADLAEESEDFSLSELALRLRLIAAEPALKSFEVDVEETLLSCGELELKLIKCSRSSGPLKLMPTFRLDCPDQCPDALCFAELTSEDQAMAAFRAVQAALKKRH